MADVPSCSELSKNGRWTGNICGEGFDTEEEIENDIVKYHKEIIIQISEDLEEEEESTLDESYGKSWLAKFEMETSSIKT